MPERSYYVYIMANRSGTLYIGVTNDLERRVAEHRAKLTPGFTARYNITRLVYYEDTDDVLVRPGTREAAQRLAPIQEGRADPEHEPSLDGPGTRFRSIAKHWEQQSIPFSPVRFPDTACIFPVIPTEEGSPERPVPPCTLDNSPLTINA